MPEDGAKDEARDAEDDGVEPAPATESARHLRAQAAARKTMPRRIGGTVDLVGWGTCGADLDHGDCAPDCCSDALPEGNDRMQTVCRRAAIRQYGSWRGGVALANL